MQIPITYVGEVIYCFHVENIRAFSERYCRRETLFEEPRLVEVVWEFQTQCTATKKSRPPYFVPVKMLISRSHPR